MKIMAPIAVKPTIAATFTGFSTTQCIPASTFSQTPPLTAVPLQNKSNLSNNVWLNNACMQMNCGVVAAVWQKACIDSELERQMCTVSLLSLVAGQGRAQMNAENKLLQFCYNSFDEEQADCDCCRGRRLYIGLCMMGHVSNHGQQTSD